MNRLFYILMCGLLLPFASCSNNDNDVIIEGEEEAQEVVTELVLSEPESRAAQQVQGFNEEFFKALVASNPGQANVVCSPLSASVLLSMVANAADGEVAREIANGLHCSDVDALNSLSKKYLTVLPNADPAVAFTSANSVWYHNEYTISPAFAKVAESFYDAPNFGRNFKGNTKAIVSEINSWCNEKTNGIIEQMISHFPEETVSVLADAIYFKGQWGIPFDKKKTEAMNFHGINGITSVDMMFNSGCQHYLDADNCQAVKMQIGDGKFEAIFMLPKTDVDSFIAQADFADIIGAKYSDTYIRYYLPRFKYEPEQPLELNKSLAGLGMISLDKFSPLAMFTTPVDARHGIIQKTGVEFNEEGAEGASVTMDIIIESNMGSEQSHPIVRFDRPFAFIIRETTTGAMLFAGKISEL